MDINVAQLLKEPIGAERRYHVEEEGTNARYLTEVLRLEGDITLLRSSCSVLVTSRLKALVEMTCVRCLGSFRQLIPVEFKEEYFPLLDVSTGLRLPPPNDPTSFTISPDHVLDLKEALRQHTLLALPMKPVCRQDCLGLCQLCGVDRNQGSCQCPDEPADPRLASLAELKSKLA